MRLTLHSRIQAEVNLDLLLVDAVLALEENALIIASIPRIQMAVKGLTELGALFLLDLAQAFNVLETRLVQACSEVVEELSRYARVKLE